MVIHKTLPLLEIQEMSPDEAVLLVTGHDKQEYSDCLGDDGMESVTDNDDNDVQHDHGQGQPVIIKYCSILATVTGGVTRP